MLYGPNQQTVIEAHTRLSCIFKVSRVPSERVNLWLIPCAKSRVSCLQTRNCFAILLGSAHLGVDSPQVLDGRLLTPDVQSRKQQKNTSRLTVRVTPVQLLAQPDTPYCQLLGHCGLLIREERCCGSRRRRPWRRDPIKMVARAPGGVRKRIAVRGPSFRSAAGVLRLGRRAGSARRRYFRIFADR